MELRRLLEEFQSSAKAADAASSDRMDKLYKQQQSDIDQILCRLDALTINAENRKSTADALWEQRLQRLEESLLASDGQNRVIDKDFSNGSDFERLEKRLDKRKHFKIQLFIRTANHPCYSQSINDTKWPRNVASWWSNS